MHFKSVTVYEDKITNEPVKLVCESIYGAKTTIEKGNKNFDEAIKEYKKIASQIKNLIILKV